MTSEWKPRRGRALATARKEDAVLAEIGHIISSSLVINEIYERFADAVKELIPYDTFAIVTADMERGVLFHRYFKGAGSRARPGREEIPLAGTIAEAAIENGSALYLREGPGNPLESRFPGSFLLSDFPDAKAVISTPVVYRGRAIAVLNLASENPDAYTENHISLAQSVADQIAGAVASAQLHAQLARESRELTALNRLFQQKIAGEAEATGRYRELRERLERLAREADDLLERVKERPPPGLDEAPGGDAGDSPSQL